MRDRKRALIETLTYTPIVDRFSPLRYWDLCLVALLALLELGVVYYRLLPGNLARIVLALLCTLFLVGYAFTTALFPRADPFDVIDRVGLSVGASVAITALVTLALNFSPWGIRATSVAVALTAVTVAAVVVGGVRRAGVIERDTGATPFVRPFDVYVRLAYRGFRERLRSDERGALQTVLSVALVAAILLSAASVAYAVSTPRPGERYTEFSMYTEENGTLVAGHYPTTFRTGRGKPVVLAVHNHEFERVSYRVEVQARDPETGHTERITRIATGQVDHDETWRRTVTVAPPFPGRQVRIEFLLSRDESPSTGPSHQLSLLTNVTDPG